jgi:uncharacterized delta-60 repeat protein
MLEDRCLLSGGVLDPTFGSGGLVITPPLGTSNSGSADAVAVDPANGTIVAAGTADDGTQNNFKVARFTANGGLDPAFGTGGIVTTSFGSSQAVDVAIQPLDHKIVAAGTTSGNDNVDFALARYNTNETLDNTFGKGGKLTTNFSGKGKTASYDAATSMALQADGKIVVAGVTSSGGPNNIALARYNPDGSLDSTFGKGGLVTTADTLIPGSVGNTEVYDMALEPDGSIVVVGSTEISPVPHLAYHAFVVRYTNNGSLDSSFAGTGIETLNQQNTEGNSGGQNPVGPRVVIQPADGKIIMGWDGFPSGSDVLVRLNKLDGSLDSTFGTAGVAIALPGGGQRVESITLEPADGMILLAGISPNSNGWRAYSVARFQTTGALDTSFGANGIAMTPDAFQQSSALDMAVQPDGRIVLAGGGSLSGAPGGMALARFLATGPQISSFTASPNPVPPPGSLTLTVSTIIDSNPGASITQVEFYYYAGGNKVTLGTVTQPTAGAWTLTSQNAFGLTTGTYTIYAQAEDSYGVFGDQVSLTLTVL